VGGNSSFRRLVAVPGPADINRAETNSAKK
jgi:hypothetical protein